MKYMLMMFGDAETMMETQSPEWIKEMIGFMQRLDTELTESGELVFQLGLTDGSTAKVVRIDNGLPVTTDGPYAESKESLIGYWVVDVEDEARALDIASRIAVYSQIVEVRQGADEPPEMDAGAQI
ncbi:MAG: transcription initiation protein [Actinomycetia bacterium]|jgi:hypothetical protein|nr:transcription initiation protein [Actinomycetes bacterium]